MKKTNKSNGYLLKQADISLFASSVLICFKFTHKISVFPFHQPFFKRSCGPTSPLPKIPSQQTSRLSGRCVDRKHEQQ